MARATREPLPGGGVVLAVPDGLSGPPLLRFERVTDRKWILRQGERPLIQARSEGDGCCRDLHLCRLPGHRSPLPPLTAAAMRTGADWPHRYALWLEEAGLGPLHYGRWLLTPRSTFAPGIWDCDLVQDWPDATLELLCGGGWHGVLPLRPLPTPDASRVKAYRKHAREGTLAPVLLWWVSFLDGWLLLDGHDRAAAALAEGMQPACVELVRVPDDADWRATAEKITEAHEERVARLAERPAGPHTARERQVLDRGYADVISTLAYDANATPVFEHPRD
ncbi:hypothetical protein [Streptomyces phaeochromogenes]|uniref:hypothetical protein n=1 Tax=Streptomyces phaeochromogenes TaxID=1923 RepID=UPI0006E40624|nr:hypothetical protein [Streptomyces phaeochromogenes]